MENTPRGILWVAAADPWSAWTLSGISRCICIELQRRQLLYGATHPGEVTRRHLHRPGPLYALEKKVLNKLGLGQRTEWVSETDGLVGTVLRRCPPGTAVIYVLL